MKIKYLTKMSNYDRVPNSDIDNQEEVVYTIDAVRHWKNKRLYVEKGALIYKNLSDVPRGSDICDLKLPEGTEINWFAKETGIILRFPRIYNGFFYIESPLYKPISKVDKSTPKGDKPIGQYYGYTKKTVDKRNIASARFVTFAEWLSLHPSVRAITRRK